MKIKLILSIFLALFFLTEVHAQFFIPGQSIPSTNGNQNVKFADLDNDGDLDLVRLIDGFNGSSTLNNNEVWLNDGNGVFSLHSTFGLLGSNYCDFGDIDNDGDIDIFVCNSYGVFPTNDNRVWLNNGSAYFTSNGQSIPQSGSYRAIFGDFDGDGDLDVAVANGGNTNYDDILYLNDGFGQFTASAQPISNLRTGDMKAADLDFDGDLDLIISTLNSNNVLLNDGSGVFTDNGQNIGSAFTGAGTISLGDANSDGFFDIIVHTGNSVYSQYLGGANATFSFDQVIVGPSIQYVDIDADNDLDVMTISPNSADTLRMLINDGLGNYTAGSEIVQDNGSAFALGDIDADNDNDLIFMSINGINSRFWVNQQTVSTVVYQEICTNDSIFLQNQWVTEAGVYTDTIKDILGIDSVLISTILSLLPIEFTWQFSICDGDSLLIQGNYVYAPGTYSDTMSGSNGCDSINIYNITVVGVNDTIVDNGFYLQAPVYNTSYQWYDCNLQQEIIGENNRFFYPTYLGDFSVIMNNGLCVDTSICFNLACRAYFEWEDDTSGVYDVVVYAMSLGIDPISHLWQFGDGDSSQLAYPTHVYPSPGNYQLCYSIIDSAGCSSTFCDTITVDYLKAPGDFSIYVVPPPILSSIETEIMEDNLNIVLYPNPATNSVSLKFNRQLAEVNISIYSIDGKKVYDKNNYNQKEVKIGVSQLKPGIYFVRTVTDKYNQVLKLVIK